MQNKVVIGVDIGGTSISAGCLVENTLVKKSQADTGSNRSVAEILKTLYEVIDLVWTKDVKAIGIGVPGYIDVEKGEIRLINNIPAFQGLVLKNEVENHYNVPAYINNDANSFALGAYYFGIQSVCTNVVGITIGTGLGGGIVLNGKLHSGLFGGAGEFGLIPYLDATFEDYCSSKFFANKYNTNGKDLFVQAKNGDSDALIAFEEFGNHIGNLILYILYTLSPEIVIIGGSISKSSEFFMSGIRMVIEKFPVGIIRKNFKIEVSQLEYPEIYGAAALCLSEFSGRVS